MLVYPGLLDISRNLNATLNAKSKAENCSNVQNNACVFRFYQKSYFNNTLGLPQPPDEEHHQPVDPEPGGGGSPLHPGLCPRHRQ